MSDWNLPTTGSLYTDLVNGLKSRDLDSATMFATLPTNPVADMVRWDSAANKFDVYNGVAWVSLSSSYAINVTSLNGQLSSFYQNAGNLNAGTLLSARFNDTSHGSRGGGTTHSNVVAAGASGFMTGTDKTKLNAIESNAKADQTGAEIKTAYQAEVNAFTDTLFTKLNAIESGATIDQTANDILTLLKTVDTNTSGLNSNTLQGNTAAAFATAAHAHTTFDRLSSILSGASVFSNLVITDGIVTAVATRSLTPANIGAQVAGTYNTIIGTDSDINTSGSTIIDNIYVTDGVITSMGTRVLTLANLGYTGETNATADQTAAQILAALLTVDSDSSGLNSNKLQGQVRTSASTVNTVVSRDGSGDINARLFKSEYDSTNASIGFIMTQIDTASNNYIRPSTPAQFRAAVTDAIYLGKTAIAVDSVEWGGAVKYVSINAPIGTDGVDGDFWFQYE